MCVCVYLANQRQVHPVGRDDARRRVLVLRKVGKVTDALEPPNQGSMHVGGLHAANGRPTSARHCTHGVPLRETERTVA